MSNIPQTAPPRPTLSEALLYWLKLGFISFGGPAGQIAMMHQELVEKRRWISEHRFLHALNFCMLLPGPEAIQLAIYISWLMHGVAGAIIAGVCFFMPAFALLSMLASIYLESVHVPQIMLDTGRFFRYTLLHEIMRPDIYKREHRKHPADS